VAGRIRSIEKFSESLEIKLAIVLQPTTLLCAAMDSYPGCKVAICLYLVFKSIASTTQELLERKSSSSGLETQNTVVGDPPR
jgi:hypothetical protein